MYTSMYHCILMHTNTHLPKYRHRHTCHAHTHTDTQTHRHIHTCTHMQTHLKLIEAFLHCLSVQRPLIGNICQLDSPAQLALEQQVIIAELWPFRFAPETLPWVNYTLFHKTHDISNRVLLMHRLTCEITPVRIYLQKQGVFPPWSRWFRCRVVADRCLPFRTQSWHLQGCHLRWPVWGGHLMGGQGRGRRERRQGHETHNDVIL